MTTPRWYMVNKMGMATLCANKADAQQEAADAQSLWPDMGPHRAVQLVEAAQQESFDRSPQATSIEEAARDVGKWLNERPNRPIDLRHVAMLCAHATAAHQQEAQEPVAWYVTGCGRLLDEDEAKAEARHIGGTARAIPLYTAPQADSVTAPVGGWHPFPHYLQNPDGRLLRTSADLLERHGYTGCSTPLRRMADALLNEPTAATPPTQAADSVLEDAARYRWLRERMLGIDFDWNESGITALSFEMPDGCAYGGCCNQNIDAAMNKGGAA